VTESARRRSWARRLRDYLRSLDRPRKVALTIGLVLVLVGLVLVVLAPPPARTIPTIGTPRADAPTLRYIRSLPDAGDPLLVRPVGLAVGRGYLYVADSGDAVVRVFSTAGPVAGEIGRGTLRVPTYLARDLAAGTLLVTDRELRGVFRFGEGGEPLGQIVPSIETSATWEPLGIAADGEGTVVVTDTSGKHQVLVMDRAGQVSRVLGGPVSAEAAGGVSVSLDYPNSVGFWGDELWVADSNNRRVLVFDADGALKRLIRVDGIARGLAFLEGEREEDRFVAVADALTSEIVLLDADGDEVTRYGGPGGSAGRLAYPNDVAFDMRTGQLFVADMGNARVQVWGVTWPGESTGPLLPLPAPVLSAMRVAGVILGLVGTALAGMAVWPRREARKLPDESGGL
jgi:DNA-binding beta-propeller fold protein YncE